MPFMITYCLVDYAYFSLAMSFDRRKARELRFKEARDLPPTFDKTVLNTNGNLGKAYGELLYCAISNCVISNGIISMYCICPFRDKVHWV